MTPQRRAIAEVLKGEHMHLTVDEIHRLARSGLPELSVATVYNTLTELRDLGEVLELTSPGGGPKRYDPNLEHQHLVCVDCGEMRDVHPLNEEALSVPKAERAGFDIFDTQITFHGRCRDCTAKLARSGSHRR